MASSKSCAEGWRVLGRIGQAGVVAALAAALFQTSYLLLAPQVAIRKAARLLGEGMPR